MYNIILLYNKFYSTLIEYFYSNKKYICIFNSVCNQKKLLEIVFNQLLTPNMKQTNLHLLYLHFYMIGKMYIVINYKISHMTYFLRLYLYY